MYILRDAISFRYIIITFLMTKKSYSSAVLYDGICKRIAIDARNSAFLYKFALNKVFEHKTV